MTPDREDIALHLPVLEKYASKASSVLEIGCECGDGSTRAFIRGLVASKAVDKIMVSVDMKDFINAEDRPTVPFWHFYKGNSMLDSTFEEVNKIADGRKFDIIFIDTEHNYDVLKRELEVWKSASKPTTAWLFHDTYMQEKYNHMTDAIKEFASVNTSWEYKDLSIKCNGLGALICR